MSNVARVLLSEDVEDVIEQAGQDAAHRVLEEAYMIQEREHRPMTLAEALQSVGAVASGIEELYRRFDHANPNG